MNEKSGAPRLIESAGETSLFYKNTNLYGNGPVSASACKRADNFTLTENTLFLIASPLLWYGVKEILDRLPESSFLLAVEHDTLLAELSSNRMPEPIRVNSRFYFLPSTDSDTLYRQLVSIGIHRFRKVRLLSLNRGYRLYHEQYSRLNRLLEEEVQQFWHNKYTLMHMLPLWVKNLFTNLCDTVHPADGSSVSFGLPKTNKPVVVAGAGPSLDFNIRFLSEYRDYYYLLAVDTAFSSLSKAGLRPDLIVVQEAQFANLYDFIPHPVNMPPVAADITSYPGVLRLSDGKIYFYSTAFLDICLLQRLRDADLLPESIVPMGSVGNTAIDIAMRISRGPVIFTGIDFAFRPGKTHANGSPAHIRLLQGTHRFGSLLDYSFYMHNGIQTGNGKRNDLLTTSTLERYARNFQRYFATQQRIYQLMPEGLSLGAALINHQDAADILTTCSPHNFVSANGVPDVGTPDFKDTLCSVDSVSAHRFLSHELSLLKEIYEAGRSYLNGEITPSGEQRFRSNLNHCEYIFLPFADTGYRIDLLNPNLVKRLMVSTGHYIEYLKKRVCT